MTTIPNGAAPVKAPSFADEVLAAEYLDPATYEPTEADWHEMDEALAWDDAYRYEPGSEPDHVRLTLLEYVIAQEGQYRDLGSDVGDLIADHLHVLVEGILATHSRTVDQARGRIAQMEKDRDLELCRRFRDRMASHDRHEAL